MNLSAAGLAMIGRFEGYRRWPYNDPAGHATIGYGHLLHLGGVTVADRLRYPLGLSVPAALALLRRDCAQAEAAVQRYVTRPLGSGQYDALVSFAFNVGPGAFAGSTLLHEVNLRLGGRGSDEIRREFGRWVKAGGVSLPGLVVRRAAEAELYLQGKYPT